MPQENAPPSGATLVSGNPAPFIIAPKRPDDLPPKGAQLLKSSPAESTEQIKQRQSKAFQEYKPEDTLTKVSRGATIGAFEGVGVKPAATGKEVITGTLSGVKDLVKETWQANSLAGATGYGPTGQAIATSLDLIPTAIDRTATALEDGAKKAYKAIQDRDWEAAAEHITSTAVTVATLRGGRKTSEIAAAKSEIVSKVQEMRNPVLGPKDAARAITDAVNPPPKAMVTYESTLSEHMPKVLDYAKRNGIEIADRESLAGAMKGAADELHAEYDKTYIEPTKDVQVPTDNIPGYKGGTVDHNTTTVAQLNARLKEINATLSPSYEKGGATAQSAVSAESKAALNAEAAAIRSKMNAAVAKKLGLEPKQVADARSDFGSLRNAADKTQMSANMARYTKNMNKRGVDLPTSKAGAVHAISRKLFAKDPDKAIARTMEQLHASPPAPAPSPNPPQPAPFPRRNVVPESQGTEIGTRGTPQADITAHQQQISQRAVQVQKQRAAAEQARVNARNAIQARAKALKAASDKLGPRASTKEIMAEADKATAQQ